MKNQALVTCLFAIIWSAPLTALTNPLTDHEIRGVAAERSPFGENLQTRGTTIEKKDGQIITGTIKDTVVQKGKVTKDIDEKGGKLYDVSYTLSNGDRITAIDRQGVHSTWIFSIGATEEGQPPNDLEVLTPGKTGFMNPRKGGKLIVIAMDYGPRVPIKDTLLGTVRKKPGNDQEIIIVPELEIVTANGIVKLPVSEIVAFQENARE